MRIAIGHWLQLVFQILDRASCGSCYFLFYPSPFWESIYIYIIRGLGEMIHEKTEDKILGTLFPLNTAHFWINFFLGRLIFLCGIITDWIHSLHFMSSFSKITANSCNRRVFMVPLLIFFEWNRGHEGSEWKGQCDGYTLKKGLRFSRPQPGFHLLNSPWTGIINKESWVRDIPAGDGKTANLFLHWSRLRTHPFWW